MAPLSVAPSVRQLAAEQEEAGLTFEQMLDLLNSGVTVEDLLRIIQWKLSGAKVPPGATRWIM